MSKAPLVTVLTYCAHPSLAYGSLLVFDTLRVGFPTAQVEVYDNGSHPEVAEKIAQAAERVGASFHALTPKHYADHYEWLLLKREHDTRPLVLLDPDVIFWADVEAWEFGKALFAGRLIPKQREGLYTSLPRIHPSLFWVPSVDRLRLAVAAMEKNWDALGCTLRQERGAVTVRDTLSPLYERLGDRCYEFDALQLECYDHLFHGSHLSINAACDYAGFEAIEAGHAAVLRGDPASVRGIWRAQQAYFERDHPTTRLKSEQQSRTLSHFNALHTGQGFEYDEEGSQRALAALATRMQLMRRASRRNFIGAEHE